MQDLQHRGHFVLYHPWVGEQPVLFAFPTPLSVQLYEHQNQVGVEMKSSLRRRRRMSGDGRAVASRRRHNFARRLHTTTAPHHYFCRPNAAKQELPPASHGHHHLFFPPPQAGPHYPRPHVQVAPQLPQDRRVFIVMNGRMGLRLLRTSWQKTIGNSRSTSCKGRGSLIADQVADVQNVRFGRTRSTKSRHQRRTSYRRSDELFSSTCNC
jgi:hypothetical protein